MLFGWPHGLRFPTRRLNGPMGVLNIAFAVAFFFGSELQSLEMFAQRVSYQGGAVPLSPPCGLVSMRFHMLSLLHSMLNISRIFDRVLFAKCWFTDSDKRGREPFGLNTRASRRNTPSRRWSISI